MNRAAAILTKMKRSEQKQIRDDERRILDALRSSGSMSDRTAEETLSRIKLVMAQGRLVLDKVSPRAHKALFSHRALRDRFLASNSACAAFIMSIDIRRSAELMLNARSAELFAEFMAGLCEELKGLICERFGIVDKFTGDGLLASFPESEMEFFQHNTEVQQIKHTLLMEHENLNLEEIMESRRHAVEELLRIISVDELKALTDELFPYADHPWLETFLNVVSDPTSGTFHHAVTDDRLDEVKLPIHILYCHDKEIGMWFIRGSGKGPLQPEELKIMKEIVEAGR